MGYRQVSLLVLILIVVDDYTVSAQELQYLGCFDLSYSLSQNIHHHLSGADATRCAYLCSHLNKAQVGVERSDNFCYCGNDIAEESIRKNDTFCNVPCPGSGAYACGGDWLMSLYTIVSATTESPTIATTRATDNITGTDVDDLGFLLGHSIGARFYKARRMADFDTIISTEDSQPPEWVYSVDYHYAKNLAFANLKKKLLRASLNSKMKTIDVTPKLVKTMSSSCEGFAVDWVEDLVYVAECSEFGFKILSMDLDGKNVTEVMAQLGSQVAVKRMVIDPYKRKLFWTADGVVESYDLLGNTYNTNISAEGVMVRALTLDLEARRVFYTGTLNSSNSLYSVDYEGDDSVLHYSISALRSVYGLGVFRDSVYWLNYAAVDIVYKGPKTKNGTLIVQILSTIKRAVWHMKIVHPDLQSPPKKKSCPIGSELGLSETDCVAMELAQLAQTRSPPSRLPVVLWSLLLILVGVILVASLVYLGDKHWATLRSRLPGVSLPYSRERGSEDLVTSQYHADAEDDNVRLV